MVDEMEQLADLGADLYPRQGPSTRLRTRALAAPAPRPAWVRPVLVASGIAVLAVGMGVVASTTGGEAPRPPGATQVNLAAFTVQRNGDGSVTLTIRELVDTQAATRALNNAGIAGRVVNVVTGEDSQTPPCDAGPINVADLYGRHAPLVLDGHGGGASITLRSSDYSPGGGLLLAVRVVDRKADGRTVVALMAAAFKDAAKIPGCVRVPQPAPSGPDDPHS